MIKSLTLNNFRMLMLMKASMQLAFGDDDGEFVDDDNADDADTD